MTRPFLGWYGDDFTGATDTLAVAARAGLRARLFLGVPSPECLASAGPLDAVGIAGAARAMTPSAMADELAPVGAFMASLGVRILHYKCCSTFDSAPGTGSIGVALRSLAPFFPNPFRPIVGGQPSLGRYCAFSTLFASAGQDGEIVRIDRHPTMSRHPVTPMGEADLRRHLGHQDLAVAAVHLPVYGAPAGVMDAAIRSALDANPDAVLLDVTSDAQLGPIGRLIRARAEAAPLLAIGPSSVVQALAATDGPAAEPSDPPLGPAPGPVFVLAGSLSPVTREQVAQSPSFEPVTIDPRVLLAGPDGIEASARGILDRLAAGRHVLACTAEPTRSEGEAGPAVAAATARLAARILGAAGLRRAAFAGGDTSSFATLGLGIDSLSFQTTLGRGVTLCRTHAAEPALDGIELALKGGQMGPPDIFERLVHGRP